jgi:hypothetical protein
MEYFKLTPGDGDSLRYVAIIVGVAGTRNPSLLTAAWRKIHKAHKAEKLCLTENDVALFELWRGNLGELWDP